MTRCGECGGHCGGGDPVQACVCGQVGSPFRAPTLAADEWQMLRHLCATRSGGLCELRIPGVCLGGPSGDLWGVPGVSLHHRQPRGMGGASRLDVHSLAVLLLACGDGVRACHGWVESHRAPARARHLLVPQGVDPVTVPLILPGGQVKFLDPVSPLYLDPPDGPAWHAA